MPRARTKYRETEAEVTDTVLRDLVGYNLKRAYITMRDDLVATLAEFDLQATTFAALTMVAAHPGMTQSQLATALRIERSGVVLLIDRLEERGLIVRDQVPNNRRSYALRATNDGVRLSARVLDEVRGSEARLLDHMTVRQKGELIALLQTVEDADAA